MSDTEETAQGNSSKMAEEQPVSSIAVTAKIPDFWQDAPRLWFIQFEAVLKPQHVAEEAKYHLVISKLGKEVITQVTDILIAPPDKDKYKTLKQRLLIIYEESQNRQVQKLIGEMELGDQKPSQLLRRMKDLARDKVSDEALQIMWQNHLPSTVRGVLAVADSKDLSTLALIADKVLETAQPINTINKIDQKQPKQEDNDIVAEIRRLNNRIRHLEMDRSRPRLITDSFKINSGNSATKRKREDALTHNFKIKMSPHSLNFNKSPSPIVTPKRRVLGELQNIASPLFRPKESPTIERLKNSPLTNRSLSPLTSKSFKKSTTKITRIFEERSMFKMNKENENFISETFVKLDMEEETRDCSFGESFQSTRTTNWSMTKLDFTDTLPQKPEHTAKEDIYVPEKDMDLDQDLDTLQDLEEEFENDNFDECTKYEIISTDSPNIISRGRPSTSRKVNSRNFEFGAPIAESEQSTSFNRPTVTATRMLNFEDENFEFTSPPAKKGSTNNLSVKKSLKFTETPTKNSLRHERSDSSIGSMSSFSSPASTRSRFTSTHSMESGFVSEFEEPFLELEEQSNSPKMANFNDLLSGPIKDNILTEKTFGKPSFHRSLSFNPSSSRAKVSLFSILENPEKKTQKRTERSEEEESVNKRRKHELFNPEVERVKRPVLQRCFSENNASIMSALARSAAEPDLIGDFSQPFALPLTSGDHADLKSISCDTLANLISGEYNDSIGQFKVIDCRYPYEFEGGHIVDAVNLHTAAQVQELVAEPRTEPATAKRTILVFHCEFSLERGPKLSRVLRSTDRQLNKEHYPSLHYPEVYLLHGGYRAFHQRYPRLCSPAGYVAMLDPRHKHALKKHRSNLSENGQRARRLLL